MLIDYVPLENFDSCMDGYPFTKKIQRLVTGARESVMVKRCFWISMSREVVTYLYSQSSREDMLNVWPALPRFIQFYGEYLTESVESAIAVLERNNRVSNRHHGQPDVLIWKMVYQRCRCFSLNPPDRLMTRS